jgi:hypothetical protein
MQIHELTNQPRAVPSVPVFENWAQDLMAPLTLQKKQSAAAAKQAELAAVTPAAVAQKAQAIWNKYVQDWEADLTDPREKADFLSRKDGMYKKQLLAFVQKNLLPGVDINRVINRDVILKIVDALSAPNSASGTGTAPAAIPAPAGTPAALAQTRAAKQKAIQARSGTAPLAAGTRPAATPAALAQTRAAKQKAAAAKAQAALAANPKTPPLSEALTPAAETALWKKLAGEIRRAQVDIDPSRPAATVPGGVPAGNAANPNQLVSALTQQYSRSSSAVAALGKAAVANAGTSTQVKRTGNAAADAILQMAGFQVS